MNIKNAVYSEVKVKWHTVTFPLKAGTPISLGGTVANNAQAIGLIVETINEKPLLDNINILVGGDIVLAEVEKECGTFINAEAIKAMDGIRFYLSDGTPAHSHDKYVLPEATAETLGGVKKANKVEEAVGDNPTATEFNALVNALKAAGIMAS